MPRGNLGFFTIDPATGKIAYQFSGKVLANGLDLLLGTGTPNKIRWLLGTYTGPSVGEDNTMRFPGPPDRYRRALTVISPVNPTQQSFLTIDQSDAAGVTQSAIRAQVEAFIATIINGTGQSTFPQLAGGNPLKRKIDFGNKAFNWPGGIASQQFVVNHSIGAVPLVILCTQANNNTICTYRSFTGGSTTQITVDVFTTTGAIPAAGTADNFWWLVIG